MAQSVLVKGHDGKFKFVQESGTATVTLTGTTASAAIDVSGFRHIAFIMPAAWDAATIKMTTCDTIDGTYVPVYDTSGELAVTTGANRVVSVVDVIAPLIFIKLVSSATQTAARTVKVLLSR